MPMENPFGKAPAPEQGEKQDPRQEAIDTYFELETTRDFLDDDYRAEERKRESMGKLLSQEVSEKLGEPYTVSEEEDYFYLARRQREGSGWDFDPKEHLGIFTNETLDLPTGKIQISYDINAMSKARDGWDSRYFDTPVLENTSVEFVASKEKLKQVYAVLEENYQDSLKDFEKRKKEFEEFLSWFEKNEKKRFPVSDWDTYPFLEKIFAGVSCATFHAERHDRPNGSPEYALVFEDADGRIVDIISRPFPQRPERNFPPMNPGKE